MHVNSHPHRNTEGWGGGGCCPRGLQYKRDMDAVRPKTGKERVLRTESQLFTHEVSSFACFFISLAVYASSQARKLC